MALENRGVETETQFHPREPRTPRPKRKKQALVWVLLAGTVLVALGALLLPRLLHKAPQSVIVASGRIEGREVTLAAKEIQGRVKKLLVDEGETVRKGELLAELESKQLDARYAGLAANVANLDAQIRAASIDVAYTTKNTAASLAAAQAAVNGAKARLARAKAVLGNSRATYERTDGLYKSGIVAKSVFDQATMDYQASQADVDASEHDLTQAEANLAVAHAASDTVKLKTQHLRALEESRRSAEAQLKEAEANLAERNIYAPTDGTILSRTVEVGDVVSPGAPIFVMVDMKRLYLKVYVPEPDIPKLKLGDPADITVDAFPGKTFPARISKIYQQAEFTPKNVETKEERVKLVFGVELMFVKPEAVLKPGMPADCAIHWRATRQAGSQ